VPENIRLYSFLKTGVLRLMFDKIIGSSNFLRPLLLQVTFDYDYDYL